MSTATISRPTIVIKVPRWRNKPPAMTAAATKVTSISLTVAKFFRRMASKLWENRLFRYASYFVGAVAGAVVAHVGFTVIGLLLAVPFLLLGWYLLAEITFTFAYMLAWYVLLVVGAHWADEKLLVG